MNGSSDLIAGFGGVVLKASMQRQSAHLHFGGWGWHTNIFLWLYGEKGFQSQRYLERERDPKVASGILERFRVRVRRNGDPRSG